MPFLTAQNARLEYELIPGQRAAPQLCLLHEGLGCVALWRDLPARLAAATGCRTLAYSRQGYGQSDRLAVPRTVDYMHREGLDVLPLVLQQLGVDDPVLIGHSDGASIAMIYAGCGRRRTRGLVLIAPHVFVEDKTVAGIEAAAVGYRTTDLKQRLARYHAQPDETFWGWNDIWLRPEFRAWSIESFLGGISCPLLLIQGADDEYGTLAQFERIRRGVASRDITELVLPHCGHAPQRDQPARLERAIADFVAKL